MELEFKKEIKDKRGKIIFLQYGKRQINIVEIKKDILGEGIIINPQQNAS
ncbi:hypothetical protein [Candidatus Nitrosotenuis uzonensis]|uniref:Uncharacterized protein n=1 Tax=Candidatus Nitrosotenuis uzonensis TaxID=1407055 RepID=A0A812EYR8_9ARCH|nr:hypothetical protein [Candidatus Nitrosotenuis uzonensis]CAE6486942.1 hypothetical protein NUZ5A_20234 [Candidatus Nitrosotenuis uzonensis]